MKRIEINGEWFEVIRSKYTDDMIERHGADYRGRRTLYDFYDNPSAIKERIWDSWREWAANSFPVVNNMLVISASHFAFTIGALYVDPDTYEVLGYFKITKDHNRLYLYK